MADVTISDLSPITPSTGLFLPASNNSTTGKVTLSQVCGVMTSAQITTALGYTPYNSTNPAGYITASSLPSSQQLARAWVNFDGTGAVNTNQGIRSSFNVGSVFKISTGDYRVNFSSSLGDGNFAVVCQSGIPGGYGSIAPYGEAPSAFNVRVGLWGTTGVFRDSSFVSVVLFR